MLIFSFAKVVFWAQLGKFIYNMGSIGEFNLQMQSNSPHERAPSKDALYFIYISGICKESSRGREVSLATP